MKIAYEFHGGNLNMSRFTREEVEKMCYDHTEDCSFLRELGILCHRKELDNQPKVLGYVGPMWDGIRYVADTGKEYYDHQLTKEQKQGLACFAVLRYETQEVYNMLSR